MKEKIEILYKDLLDQGYDILITKDEYSSIVGSSTSAVDHNISKGCGIPNYSKLGTKKNSPVRFYLRDVAEYIIAQQIQIA
ncbi:MAG: hypothetical protein JXQ76_06325 [Campylobacterales bacterium]|nr:hypothetical protein [Campylobacterales bacterium]